jgi:hypothetical protein
MDAEEGCEVAVDLLVRALHQDGFDKMRPALMQSEVLASVSILGLCYNRYSQRRGLNVGLWLRA